MQQLSATTGFDFHSIPLAKWSRICSVLATIVFGLVLLPSCSNGGSSTPASPTSASPVEVWPTAGWEYDTLRLADYWSSLPDSFPGRYGLVVAHNGKIVFEHYQAPYGRDDLIHVNSCTKTVIALLFGAVFQQRFAEHEHRAAIDYFPDYDVDEPAIREIQNRHLLSMSSGLQWRGGIDATDVIRMSETDDWARYVFQRAVHQAPGQQFHYNSGGSQVIATILDRSTAEGLPDFADDRLFRPLAIFDYRWDTTPRGIPKAGWGLHLRIADMAKLGHLMLREGRWQEQQIVPAAWVRTVSRAKTVADHRYDYGYQVWIPKYLDTEAYLFRGSYPPATKIIAVLPELNAVVAYAGENYATDELLQDFVVPGLRAAVLKDYLRAGVEG